MEFSVSLGVNTLHKSGFFPSALSRSEQPGRSSRLLRAGDYRGGAGFENAFFNTLLVFLPVKTGEAGWLEYLLKYGCDEPWQCLAQAQV